MQTTASTSLASSRSFAPDRICALLRTSHFLNRVPSEVVARLAASARVLELAAEDRLWHEGEPAAWFHVIAQGLITIRRSLASGTEVIVAIFGARENVGDTAALERGAYPAEAVVTSETARVVRVDAQVVLHESARSPELSLALQQTLCRHSAALRAKVEILAAGAVPVRLANLFLHLASRFGDDADDGMVVVPLALSRAALASLVSARTETVIRTLRPWEDSGLVVTTDRGFLLGDMAALRACAS